MKNIKIALLISSFALVLSACGGGGSGGEGSNANQSTQGSKPQNPDLTQTLVHVAEDLRFKYYSFVNGVVPNTKFYVPLGKEKYVLTPNKIYNDQWLDTSIELLSANRVLSSEAPGIKKIEVLEKIDLANKDVYDGVFPGFTSYFKNTNDVNLHFEGTKAKQLYNKTAFQFPQGAACYQRVKISPQGSLIKIDKEIKFNQVQVGYDDFIFNLDNGFTDRVGKEHLSVFADATMRGHTIKTVTGNWAGYPWKYYRVYDQFGLVEDIVFVNIDGTVYQGDMLDFEERELAKQVAEKAQRLAARNDSNTIEYQEAVLNLELLKNKCDFFNPTAHKSIQLLNNYS